jgi:hypothetical protein
VVRGTNGTSAAAHSNGANVLASWDYITMYAADEDTEPVLIYNRLPVYTYINNANPALRGTINQWWAEWNTSVGSALASRAPEFEPLTAYLRNWVWLTAPPADWSALRVKPVRD